MARGDEIGKCFSEELPSPLFGQMYVELRRVLPIYEALANDLEKWSAKLRGGLKEHVRCKWWLYTKTLENIYRWYVCLYEAKLCQDRGDRLAAQIRIGDACKSLEEYISLRKCAEYGEFANWYRGEKKLNIQKRLVATRRLLDI